MNPAGVKGINFSQATIPLTTWLLPWLALIAQLPFEASDAWTNTLSGFLCVGSPALATYSLFLTVLNRRYLAARFQALKRTVERETGPEYHFMAGRVEDAAYILQESQQCPIRANQRSGDLANLITLNGPHRQNFWQIAAKDLKNTRRGFTYSFGAQGMCWRLSKFDTKASVSSLPGICDIPDFLYCSRGRFSWEPRRWPPICFQHRLELDVSSSRFGHSVSENQPILF